jgi:RNA polymerase sigma factor (sigma-70 family)
MTESNDIELLAQYARENSDAAFATLVGRHVNLVYSVALRRTGNPHAAEEITQAVFIILARKAKGFSRKTILTGWLHQTTRLTAANYLRTEIRRQKREQEAFMQSALSETEMWTQIAPLLDDAISKLGERDRNAILLRYFENKSAREMATALRVDEPAAQKRVTRAVEKLRKFFTKRGVTLTAAAIAGAVSANSVQAAPVGLTATVTAAAAKGAAVSASTLTLIKGALKIMAWTKMKTATVVGVVLILATGTTTVIVKNYGHHARVKLQWTLAEKESFQQETIMRMNQSKMSGLACFLFADANQNQWPKNFAQLKAQRSESRLTDSNWEFVSGGNKNDFNNPVQTILFREKESRQSPDGNFVKIYMFADGHEELLSSPDDDFPALEKQLKILVQPAKN